MKIEYLNDYNFYIYLNKMYISDLEIKNRECVEKYFKKMFLNLKNNYHLDIYGYYNIKVYVNNHYGLIIDVLKLSNDYFKMPSNKVDMKIIIDNDSLFLYELDDYFFVNKHKSNIKNIYYKDKKYYIELNEEINELFYLYLIEHSNIVFDDNAYEIIMTSSKL